MRLISETPELERLDGFLAKLSQGLSMGFGSIFRIANQYLKYWGVDVTDKNRDWIKERANDSYVEEWRLGTAKTNKAIEEAIELANLDIGNELMNAQVGEMILDILRVLHNGKRDFLIYDVGAGSGDTTRAILNHLDLYPETRKIAPHCYFRLIEPSEERLVGKKKKPENEEEEEASAKEKIESHKLYSWLPEAPVYIVGTHKFLEDVGNNSIDIAVSNAVFHHMPFPDHYGMIKRKLARDGVMVVGDWHTTIWKHPAFVVPILEAVAKDKETGMEVIKDFKRHFGLEDVDIRDVEKEMGITQMQKTGHKYMIDFIRHLAIRLQDIEEQLFFLEAHEAFEDRVMNVKDKEHGGGLEADISRLREWHPAFRNIENNQQIVFPNHDLAAVIAAGKQFSPPKRRRGGSKRKGKNITAFPQKKKGGAGSRKKARMAA